MDEILKRWNGSQSATPNTNTNTYLILYGTHLAISVRRPDELPMQITPEYN